MSFNLGALLSTLVAFQLTFMGLYLFTHRRGQRRNNRLLGFLFLMFAINLLDFASRISGLILPLPFLHLLDDTFFLLYGPVLYFYTQGVVYKDFEFNRSALWHLIPGFIAAGYVIFHLFSVNLDEQRRFTDQVVTAEIPIWITLIGVGIYVHILVYLWLSKRSVSNYRLVLKDKFSTIDEINLDWLSFMIRTFFAITLVALINSILPVFGNYIVLYLSIVVLLLITFYFINRVLVKALNQPALFSGIGKADVEKYALSGLDSKKVEGYKRQLSQLMESSRPYLKTELKSKDLAQEIGISPKELSQVINQGFNKNFFDFINTYRCEEVKRILQGPDKKVTIIEAMYQSGFHSKSSFNKEFKKLTGQTPGEFKKGLTLGK